MRVVLLFRFWSKRAVLPACSTHRLKSFVSYSAIFLSSPIVLPCMGTGLPVSSVDRL